MAGRLPNMLSLTSSSTRLAGRVSGKLVKRLWLMRSCRRPGGNPAGRLLSSLWVARSCSNLRGRAAGKAVRDRDDKSTEREPMLFEALIRDPPVADPRLRPAPPRQPSLSGFARARRRRSDTPSRLRPNPPRLGWSRRGNFPAAPLQTCSGKNLHSAVPVLRPSISPSSELKNTLAASQGPPSRWSCSNDQSRVSARAAALPLPIRAGTGSHEAQRRKWIDTAAAAWRSTFISGSNNAGRAMETLRPAQERCASDGVAEMVIDRTARSGSDKPCRRHSQHSLAGLGRSSCALPGLAHDAMWPGLSKGVAGRHGVGSIRSFSTGSRRCART